MGHLVIAAGFVDLGKNYVLMETLYVALLLYLPSTQPPAHSVLKMEKSIPNNYEATPYLSIISSLKVMRLIQLTKLTLQVQFSRGKECASTIIQKSVTSSKCTIFDF